MLRATLILPCVTVPVLSRITRVTLVDISSAAPPLTRMPCSAPTPVPTMTAVGVARPSAQGQAKTMTDMQSLTHTMSLPPLASMVKMLGGSERTWLRIIHTTKVVRPRISIVGTK